MEARSEGVHLVPRGLRCGRAVCLASGGPPPHRPGRAGSTVLRPAPGRSLHTSELAGVGAPGHGRSLDREPNETTADELSGLSRDSATPTFNSLLPMTLSGALAATGFWSGRLPYILAAQLLGPHSEPLLRLPPGRVDGPGSSVGRGSPCWCCAGWGRAPRLIWSRVPWPAPSRSSPPQMWPPGASRWRQAAASPSGGRC